MKTHELIKKLQQLVQDNPEAAHTDVVLEMAGYDDNIRRNLESVDFGKMFATVTLCA